MEIDLYQNANIRIGEIASSAEYRMDEHFQNLQIIGAKFWFSVNWKKFYKFVNFPNCRILELH